MDPHLLIPNPDAIPVHWLWLQLLLTLTTALHLVAMNIMLGSGVIALFTPFWLGDAVHPMRRSIARTLPFTFAFTINLGVAPLLFLQVLYGQFFYTSSILMAFFWLSIVALLIIAYYSAYIFSFKYETLGRGPLFIGVSVLLLLIISFFFTNNVSLMQLPETWVRYFDDKSGWLLSLGDAALLPRYLHCIFSAVALGGLFVAVLYEVKKRRGNAAADGERWIRHGCTWFTVASIFNFGVGFWFLGSLPPETYSAATVEGRIFSVMMLLSVFGIVKAVTSAQVHRVFPAAAWAIATVFFMTVARDVLRMAYLKPYFSLSELPRVSQYSPLIIFLVLLGAAGFVCWWMLKTVWNAKEVSS